MNFLRPHFIATLLCLFNSHILADEITTVKKMTTTAKAFLLELNDDQKKRIQFPFKGNKRSDWHYIPKDRTGLSWREMSPKQKELSWSFFQSALSKGGYEKAVGVIASERILWEQEDQADYRDPEKYYVSFFGSPGDPIAWGARLEGHHLSINLTVLKNTEIYVTPSFFGASPDDDGAGSRPLAGEFNQALALFKSLSNTQRKKVLQKGKTPREILTKAKQKVTPLANEGLAASDMTDAQKKQLLVLIQEYIGRYRPALAEDDLAKIKQAGIEQIRFSWSGGTERGQPVYYRVQGPSFILEYINTQSGANHSHTVWRDFNNDFGRDALREHLKAKH